MSSTISVHFLRVEGQDLTGVLCKARHLQTNSTGVSQRVIMHHGRHSHEWYDTDPRKLLIDYVRKHSKIPSQTRNRHVRHCFTPTDVLYKRVGGGGGQLDLTLIHISPPALNRS